MKFIQEFIFASMLAYVFYHWYKKENGQDDAEVSAPSAEPGDGYLKYKEG